jgi:energy-coupling factor transporter ATP-binding protein EcfA2
LALSDFIKADHLQYTYPRGGDRRALNHLDLEIGPDEYLLVCGASGSGKSTLCRTFNGLIPHFYDGSLRGQVFVAGTSTADQSIADLSARVGMVFQNPEAQLFNSNVELEIAFGLESLGLPREEIKNRIAAVTEMTGIDDLLRRNPHALSSGEQQLVSIAAVLAADPQTIVLDEPYANLDHLNVRRVRQALAKIHCEGKGVIVCEHRLALTVKEAQRMTTLQRGRIVLDGPPRQVLQQDVEAYGLKSPLSALIGRRLGLIDLPLDVSALQKQAPSGSYPPDLKPELPWFFGM